MIHVKVLHAKNLPIPTKKVRKTKIYCLSSILNHQFYYKSFKSKEKTPNPEWYEEFDFYLYQCDYLTFTLYTYRFLAKDILLGQVDINMSNFLLQNAPQNASNSFQVELPITSCESPNATLSLHFTYYPAQYSPISIKSISYSTIYLLTIFNPSSLTSDYDIISNTIELSIIKAFTTKKQFICTGFYYELNKTTAWDTFGFISQNKFCYNSTGKITQICSVKPEDVVKNHEFFIIKTPNCGGTVTLNFIGEGTKFSKYENFDKKNLIKSIELEVEPNTTYCVPLYLCYNKQTFSKDVCELNHFPCLTYKTIESKEERKGESEFFSHIIERAKTIIPDLKDVNFLPIKVLPREGMISLRNVFDEFDLPISHNLKIYVSGIYAYTETDNNGNTQSDIDFWEQKYIIYDKETGRRCFELENSLDENRCLSENALSCGIGLHSFVNLNLDQFDFNKIIVFAVYCGTSLSACYGGGFAIAQILGENERLLFRNPVEVKDMLIYHCLTLLKFEMNCEDSWDITPMRNLYKNCEEMNQALDSMFDSHSNLQVNKPNLKD